MSYSFSALVDPFFLTEKLGSGYGFDEVSGRTTVTTVIDPVNTAVVITLGQSLVANSVTGTYAAGPNTHNFNIYDGGIYQFEQPILGPTFHPGFFSLQNSVNAQIGDKLIAAGVCTRAIMVPIGIGGTKASDWAVGGVLNQRIIATARRLATRGLTTRYILWHQGEADGPLGTSPSDYANAVRSAAQTFRNNGIAAPFFVALETRLGETTYPLIRSGQFSAVSTSLNIIQGPDWDTIPTSLRHDGTHFTDAGALVAAQMDVDLIKNF